MTASELRRLLKKHGCTFENGKKHTKVILHRRFTVMPRHPSAEIKTGALNAILRDLGLKKEEGVNKRDSISGAL